MNNDWNDVNLNKDILWRKVLFQGYLFLRGLHQREDVLEARKGTKKSVNVTICVLDNQKKLKQYYPWHKISFIQLFLNMLRQVVLEN